MLSAGFFTVDFRDYAILTFTFHIIEIIFGDFEKMGDSNERSLYQDIYSKSDGLIYRQTKHNYIKISLLIKSCRAIFTSQLCGQ